MMPPYDNLVTGADPMLTGKQKRFLRALGHPLKPVILIGKGELNEALIRETDEALAHHELIKVKLLESSVMDRHQASDELAQSCSADVAQVLGRTFLLYRPAKEPKLALPAESKEKKGSKKQ
jgi:RNA-binding protein